MAKNRFHKQRKNNY